MHTLLGPGALAALGAGDLVVRDGFLSRDAGLRACASVERLRQAGELKPAGVGRDRVGSAAVRSDRTTWLEPDEADADLAPLVARFDALRVVLNEQAWLGLGAMELQLACYPGGGVGYDWHRDAFRGPRNRRVTAICYLNPGWEPGHGGQLAARTPSGEVLVEPVLGRLVLFLAPEVEHRVLPSTGPRYAVTAWYSGYQAVPWA